VWVIAPGETRGVGLADAAEPMRLCVRTAPVHMLMASTDSPSPSPIARLLANSLTMVTRPEDGDFYYVQYDISRLLMSTSGIGQAHLQRVSMGVGHALLPRDSPRHKKSIAPHSAPHSPQPPRKACGGIRYSCPDSSRVFLSCPRTMHDEIRTGPPYGDAISIPQDGQGRNRDVPAFVVKKSDHSGQLVYRLYSPLVHFCAHLRSCFFIGGLVS